jgi:hypothetical protein
MLRSSVAYIFIKRSQEQHAAKRITISVGVIRAYTCTDDVNTTRVRTKLHLHDPEIDRFSVKSSRSSLSESIRVESIDLSSRSYKSEVESADKMLASQLVFIYHAHVAAVIAHKIPLMMLYNK